MILQSFSAIPCVDASAQDAISPEQAAAFNEQGVLLIRNVLGSEELALLRRETQAMVERAVAEDEHDPLVADVVYREHEITHQRVPSRIEYVVDKSPACRALLAHPFILRSVERLQGSSFIPTWDSMVFKLGGQGAEIAWHRDAGREHVAELPIFNVDVYLDASDLSNCLWAIPGSHAWSDAEAAAKVAALSQPAFRTDGATAICMRPGDVLLHNILLVHGSPAATSHLRRVIYFEFRPTETERRLGPHRPEYIPLKERVLRECIAYRQQLPYAGHERPFVPALQSESASPKLPTLRIPHADFM